MTFRCLSPVDIYASLSIGPIFSFLFSRWTIPFMLILQIRWLFLHNHSETFTIFSGGLSIERDGKSPCITVLQGRSTTVLEMEHPVVDFITICESPWSSGEFYSLYSTLLCSTRSLCGFISCSARVSLVFVVFAFMNTDKLPSILHCKF